jgi:glycosyltransferase involved in cell wall biosynthesis
MSGLGRYALEMIQQFILLEIDFKILIYGGNIHESYQKLEPYCHTYNGHLSKNLWELFLIPREAKKLGCTTLWNPTNTGPIFKNNLYTIVTVHDVAFKANPQWTSLITRLFYSNVIGRVMRISNKITTVSNFSKNEILRFYPSINETKIISIYSGCDHTLTIEKPLLKENHYIFLGNLEERKNLIRVLDAWQLAQKNGINSSLKVIGAIKERESLNLKKYIDDKSIQFLGYTDEKIKNRLIETAKGLLFPSLYEGFGFPILEAMRLGCPVITSNIGVMSEISAKFAIHVNPYNTAEIADAIQSLHKLTPQQIEVFAINALHYQNNFTWQHSVKEFTHFFSKEIRNTNK